MISRFFDFSSKPGLRPDQPVSPIIHAGQQIFSGKRGGGVLATRPRDARVVQENTPDQQIVRAHRRTDMISRIALNPRKRSVV